MTDITANSEIKSLGQVAFEAYRHEVKVAFNGDPIPSWDKLDNGAPARRGWEAAAQAVQQHMRMIDALDKTETHAAWRSVPSRWQPLPTVPEVPEAEYGPTGGAPAAGQGEAPTGKHVAVEAGPDEER